MDTQSDGSGAPMALSASAIIDLAAVGGSDTPPAPERAGRSSEYDAEQSRPAASSNAGMRTPEGGGEKGIDGFRGMPSRMPE